MHVKEKNNNWQILFQYLLRHFEIIEPQDTVLICCSIFVHNSNLDTIDILRVFQALSLQNEEYVSFCKWFCFFVEVF